MNFILKEMYDPPILEKQLAVKKSSMSVDS